MDCFAFPQLKEEAKELVHETIIQVLDGQVYDNGKVNEWINVLTTDCIADLEKFSPVRFVFH